MNMFIPDRRDFPRHNVTFPVTTESGEENGNEIHRAVCSSVGCASEPFAHGFTLREEGQVAWLESPNGLSATARYQYAGECRTNLSRFSAVGPDP